MTSNDPKPISNVDRAHVIDSARAGFEILVRRIRKLESVEELVGELFATWSLPKNRETVIGGEMGEQVIEMMDKFRRRYDAIKGGGDDQAT